MVRKIISVFIAIILVVTTCLTVAAASGQKPYTAEYLFCPGTINLRVHWTTDGKNFYCSSPTGDTVYKVDIATGEEYDETELKVYYDGKQYVCTYIMGLHYISRNDTVIAVGCRLERNNPLSGSTETLDGRFAIDVTNQEVVYKQGKGILGVFSNGDILELSSYSNGTQKAKRVAYPNYTSSSATYTFYNVSDTATDYGIFNVNGTDYLLNGESIFYATGGYPVIATYGNVTGAARDSFVMIKNADVFYVSESGSILDQFSLDDVEDIDDGNIYHSMGRPLLVSDNGDIIYLDNEWGEFRKISLRAVNVTGVSLNKSSLNLNINDSETLTANITPTNATNKKVTWSSSDTSVATVSDGTVTAVSPGTATITVTTKDGEYNARCTVKVTDPTVYVTGVSLNKSSLSLTAGTSSSLIATISPSGASEKSVTWSSSDTSVATVSDGTVTAVSPGTATITVTTKDGEHKANCKVTVTSSASVPDGYTNIDSQLTYSVSSGTAKITGYTGAISGKVTFSSYIDGYEVTAIGVGAFSQCTMTDLIIPESVTEIGNRAFANCSSLKTVHFPANLETVSYTMLINCESLVSVTVTENPWLMAKNGVLYGNYGKDLLVYPAAKSGSVFSIPSDVETICSYAFDSNKNIRILSIPASVEVIDETFESCYKLEAFDVDDKNAYFASYEDVLFSETMKTLICYPMEKSDSVYTVPEGVKLIDSNSFCMNEHLEKLILSDGVEIIADDAIFLFGLSSIVIPASLKTVGDMAVTCLYDIEVFYKGTEEEWNSISIGDYNSSLTDAVIHFEYKDSESPKSLPDIEVELVSTSTKHYLDISCDAYESGAKVYVALYDEYGKLLKVVSEDMTDGDITSVTVAKNSLTDIIKVFAWGTNSKPIGCKKIIEL